MDSELEQLFQLMRRQNTLDDDLSEARMFFSLKRKTADTPAHGGSRPGKAPNADRDFDDGYRRIFKDNFAEDSVYVAKTFRRRFRMRRDLLLRIMDTVCAHDSWFDQKVDALGKKVFILYKES